MKRQLKISVSFILIILAVYLSGCSLFVDSHNSNDVPSENSVLKLNPPIISLIGNILVWADIEHANEYEIYCNNTLQTKTGQTYFCITEVEEDAEYFVLAISTEKNYESSDASNKVTVRETISYEENESMEIELKNDSIYNIPAYVKVIYVTGEAKDTAIVLADRVDDLIIHLKDVNLVGPEGKSAIMTVNKNSSFSQNQFSTIIQVNGNNALTGGSCTSIPTTPPENSEKKGENGGKGGNGIELPLVVFQGEGSLHLCGGNGGPGGRGAASSGIKPAVYGNGGNGGKGGNGLDCITAVLNINRLREFKVFAGKGGEGGAPGKNGSIITGPGNTTQWESRFGKKGADGNPMIGEFIHISGLYIEM